MTILSVRDFRNNLATSFVNVDAGEQVYVRRKQQLYAIIKVQEPENVISPSLQRKIDKARKAYREGKCVSCSTPEELQAHFDSLSM